MSILSGGYRHLFCHLMARMKDEKGRGAEDRWVSGMIGLIYATEAILITHLAGAWLGIEVDAIWPTLGAVSIVCAVYALNYLLFMRGGGWRAECDAYERLEGEASRRSVIAIQGFLVTSLLVVGAFVAGILWLSTRM